MEDTKGAINRVIKMINDTPYIFNTEADIQGLVYSELLEEYKKDYPTGLTDSKGEKYLTKRVHREYFRGEGGRLDTVVFSEKEIELIDMYWLCIKTPQSPGYRPVKLQDAIEIKTELGGSGKYILTGINQDIERLAKLLKDKTKNAHFIFIIRWPTKNKSIVERMKNAEKHAKDKCIKCGVNFYCNTYETLFQI